MGIYQNAFPVRKMPPFVKEARLSSSIALESTAVEIFKNYKIWQRRSQGIMSSATSPMG